MTAATHPTDDMPALTPPGQRGMVERLLLGSHETAVQRIRWHQRVPGPQLPGLVSTITLLFGTWLALAPLRWPHPTDTGWFAAGWNEVLTGGAIAVLGMLRLSRPLRLNTATTLGVLLGSWLLLSPLLFDYGTTEEAIPALVNDLLVGLVVIGVTLLGHVDARRTLPPNSSRPDETVRAGTPE
ncbi:SPW repeat domain-containing protein [Nocardia gamkensis]|uniref:SPW repeat domain-containing protein n=1 Tax=Nocardia gamkensis TaxID=352869 RepID=UPI0037C9C986